MCVIIIKQKGNKLSSDIAERSAKVNPDGLGVIWLDNFEVTYHKSNEYKVLNTERPFIAHFRYATIGKVCKDNTHPFRCGANKNEWLMMNGTIRGLGDVNKTDSRVLAESLGDVPRHKWKDKLETYDCRFVTINTRNKTFQMYNKHLWFQRDGIWFSKDNVFPPVYVAVYGTLKKGYSNYWGYLAWSEYVGAGVTEDKYPLVIDGLPYLVEQRGKGHNVDVDVFGVTDATLKRLDALEGHPNWYYRKQIIIKVKGKRVPCWIYFNPKRVSEDTILHKSYKQESKHSGYGKSYYDYDLFESDMPVGFVYDKKSTESKPIQRQLFLDNFLDEEDEFDVLKETPICIDCFSDLEFDGFNNYHCKGCDGWFGKDEILMVKE